MQPVFIQNVGLILKLTYHENQIDYSSHSFYSNNRLWSDYELPLMQLKSWQLGLIIILFYLSIPFIGYGLLGTMVTNKYQIQEARIFVDIYSDKLTAEERSKKLKAIDEREKELKRTQFTLIGLAGIFFITATGLLINRHRIIKGASQ
jgi:hypothetical protein